MRGVAGSLMLPAALLVVVGLLLTPLAGWPAVTRIPAVLIPALVLLLVAVRPWQWSERQRRAVNDWTPTAKALWIGALTIGTVLFWIVLTRFRSGGINAVDFTVYFDRP